MYGMAVIQKLIPEKGVREWTVTKISPARQKRTLNYVPPPPANTVTEREILKLMALGKTTKEIAAERFLSVYTVMTHRKNIFRKLEVNNVHEATKYALRAGIVDVVEYYI
jgi:DNA-binding CsgD family transcriptional regulator